MHSWRRAGCTLHRLATRARSNPGCMPLFVALIAAIVLGEKLSTPRKAGLSLILAGAVIIVGWHAAAWSSSRTLGDALFLFAAFLSACGTVVMQRAKLEPLHAAALVSTGSLIIYLPIYLALYRTRLAQLQLAEITVQAIFQGALVPALSALFAIPLLGEWPNATDWVGIILISAGAYLASGGPALDEIRRRMRGILVEARRR